MERTMELTPTYYLSVDPGLVHCAGVLLCISPGEKASIMWLYVKDLSPSQKGGPKPDPQKAREFVEECRRVVPPGCRVVVEAQPILRRGGLALIRYNSWVEGYVMGAFPNSVQVHPSASKKHWGVASGEYRVNKALACSKARELVTNPQHIDTDHVADCVLNALYAHKKI
jgi:hypothetical protein